MKQTWRWYGPNDPVTLAHARQAGATGIVSALHHNYEGEAWDADDVARYNGLIAHEGLVWSVVESIPVHNDIKTRSGDWRGYIEKYRTSMRAVAAAGVRTVCYNFLPLVDWVRTDLRYPMPNGALALRFDMTNFVVFDVFVIARPGAGDDYPADLVAAAQGRFQTMDETARETLQRNIIAGLPGGTTSYGPEEFLREHARYRELTREDLRANLVAFLREIMPLAEDLRLRMCIHPDDPPLPLFGLPRVTGSLADFEALFGAVDSPSCGLTLCVGSLGSSLANDVVAIARALAARIHFAHLRNVKVDPDGSFVESDHLDGATDMARVVALLLEEERRRREAGDANWEIPMRPDHGHLLLSDQHATGINPGYSAIGRMRGLAELRGVIAGINAVLELPQPQHGSS